MSQSDNFFEKAVGVPITGHVVLFEVGSGGVSSVAGGGHGSADPDYSTNQRDVWAGTQIYNEKLFVPGVECILFGLCVLLNPIDLALVAL